MVARYFFIFCFCRLLPEILGRDSEDQTQLQGSDKVSKYIIEVKRESLS